MTISRDLFLSILALDSYNRGYNAGLNMSGSSLGLAQIISQDYTAAQQSVGFYATAYDVGSVAGFTGSEFV